MDSSWPEKCFENTSEAIGLKIFSFQIFVQQNLCHSEKMSPNIVIPNTCHSEHLSFRRLVIPNSCHSEQLSFRTLVKPNTCHSERLSFQTLVMNLALNLVSNASTHKASYSICNCRFDSVLLKTLVEWLWSLYLWYPIPFKVNFQDETISWCFFAIYPRFWEPPCLKF